MASTNKTTNYELSQFQSSDIPAWLTDYNGDMQKIDAGIHAAKVQADGAASGVSLLQTAISGKQDALTFDNAPIAGSQNPVTSGGIYTALQNVTVQTDAVPTEGSTKAVQSGGVYTALQGKQNTLAFDSAPVQGSVNPVTSGGIWVALQNGVSPVDMPCSPSVSSNQLRVKAFRIGTVSVLSINGIFEANSSNFTVSFDDNIPNAPTEATELINQYAHLTFGSSHSLSSVSWWNTQSSGGRVRFSVVSGNTYYINQIIFLF